jgi:hypothetical protein
VQDRAADDVLRIACQPPIRQPPLEASRGFKEGVGNAESSSIRSPGHLPTPAVEEKGHIRLCPFLCSADKIEIHYTWLSGSTTDR